MYPTLGNMNPQEPRLESWKEIGAYLQRDATTARRWEKEEGLPVHRQTHKRRSSVYAYPSEIDAWRAGRKVVPEPTPRPLWKIPAFAVTMLLCLVMVGNGVRPVAAQSASPATRQIWLSASGDEVDVNRPSADGRYVCFTDWGTGNINLRDLTTGTSRRLTTTGGLSQGGSGDYGYVCAISPDNRQAAYFWQRGRGKEHKSELRTVSLTGGEPRTVPNFSDYAEPQGWTPDSKHVLVVRNLEGGTSQIALVSVQDGSVQTLKSFPWTKVRASLSPDGRYIAYHTPADAKTQARDIFVLALDGSRENAVVQHPADDSFPFWSPDSSRIIFLSDRTGTPSLWSVPVKDGKAMGPPELVKAEFGESTLLGITRNGALYYSPLVGFRRNVYSANLDANMNVSGAPELTVQGYLNSNTGPSLSPDSQYLAYYSARPGRLYLVIRTLKSGEEREIPLSKGFEELLIFGAAPQWFPDGRSVLAVSRESERAGFGFYRVDLGSGKIELLHRTSRTAGTQSVLLSPEGKSIYHMEQAPGVFRYDLDTKSETELKLAAVPDRLALSPDGRQLAFIGRVRGPENEELSVRVMPTAGGNVREVFHTPQGSILSTLTWSPDQRYFILARVGSDAYGTTILSRIPVDGGPPEPMGISMPARILSPQLSPDGRKIFFSVWERAPEELWALENFLPKPAGSR